jgi:hypothetical protein
MIGQFLGIVVIDFYDISSEYELYESGVEFRLRNVHRLREVRDRISPRYFRLIDFNKKCIITNRSVPIKKFDKLMQLYFAEMI